PDFNQGDLRVTGMSIDFALINGEFPDESGSVFFTVHHEEDDVRFTRNGHFTTDGEGYLVTCEGYYVLDQNENPIQTNGQNFTVSQDGFIQMDNQTIPLGIAYVSDTNELAKEDNGLLNGEQAPMPADATYRVQQQALEQSNVDALQMMTQMNESYRMFETNQKVLKAYDESMGKAVSEVGRIN